MTNEEPRQIDLLEDDWQSTRIELPMLFSPTAPVDEVDLFAGRSDQLHKLINAAFQRGQQVVVYGDRGVGKTSLVNAFRTNVIPHSKSTRIFATQCFKEDNFEFIWTRIFGEFQWSNGDYIFDDLDSTLDPSDLLKLVLRFPASERPLFIFDEFDRIEDEETKLRMAETIKLFSDAAPNATLILVGIAKTIEELLVEHASVQRALKQVEMPRMSSDEIKEIVTLRLHRARMEIDDNALEHIVLLSRGMPGYAHLIGLYSSLNTIKQQTRRVTKENVENSLGECLEDAGSSVREEYASAVQSSRSGNLFKEVLLASALAEQDEFGRFSAAAVREPFSDIIGEPREIPHYSRHLTAFCDVKRGPILYRHGTPKNYQYSFIDPMMQSFVIIKGIADGIIRFDDVRGVRS